MRGLGVSLQLLSCRTYLGKYDYAAFMLTKLALLS